MLSTTFRHALVVLTIAVLAASSTAAQVVAPPPTPYGAPITLDAAKRAAAAAQAAARKMNVPMAIVVVDPAGMLVYLEKMDGVQYGSLDVAIDKAKSAALYKRSTKVFLDALAKGGDGLRFLALRGAIPVDGGEPIIIDGRIVGAIGISGGAGEQDGECARAGAGAVKS
jgi:uncharacterized protein GlcG (DUF336 family)